MQGKDVNTETQDAPRQDGWSVHSTRHDAADRIPRLRLLYHCDLDRIGDVTLPGAVGFDWLTIGRNEPLFADRTGRALPIADPQVSREQLRVRWLSEMQRFAVEPIAGARRPIGVVELESHDAPLMISINKLTLFAPGACIAIGDRVLLGLELGRVRPVDMDRLGLVGESDVTWALRDEIRSIATFGRSALVMGPTGAGKEIIARALHRTSGRASRPFVAVNCAALPETLIDAALFGHKKGAFTGAETNEKGLFCAADGGTLFLDELGELPISVQPKLLRVLQDSVVVPVGAYEGRRVDVRVIAATHRDLEAWVRAGKLREDLYHRLAAHVLRVPPLTERRFDIAELFVYILRNLRESHEALQWLWESGKSWRSAVPIGFFADLLRRQWAGNVRELENFVENTARLNLHPSTFRVPDPRAENPTPVVLSAAMAVPVDPPEQLVREAAETLGLAHKTILKLLTTSDLMALEAAATGDAERKDRLRSSAATALLSLLDTHNYRQSDVATALGISRTTLLKLMMDLQLPRAADLGMEEIADARAQTGGDLDATARLLRISPGALKKRLTQLNLKLRGRKD